MINEKLERWYSMNEVCEHLGITSDTCLSWIEKRGMPAVKIGRICEVFDTNIGDVMDFV